MYSFSTKESVWHCVWCVCLCDMQQQQRPRGLKAMGSMESDSEWKRRDRIRGWKFSFCRDCLRTVPCRINVHLIVFWDRLVIFNAFIYFFLDLGFCFYFTSQGSVQLKSFFAWPYLLAFDFRSWANSIMDPTPLWSMMGNQSIVW